jgi:hypothetical protein
VREGRGLKELGFKWEGDISSYLWMAIRLNKSNGFAGFVFCRIEGLLRLGNVDVARFTNAEHGGVGKTRAWTQNYRSTALSIEQLNKHCSN